MSVSGNALGYSTFINGDVEAIALDSGGSAYVTGQSDSTFTTTPGAFRTSGQCFVAKLSPSGNSLAYGTFLASQCSAYTIAVDSTGNAFVAGKAGTTDFPVVSAFQGQCASPSNSTCDDAFVSKLNPNGSALIYSTFLGGSPGKWSGTSVKGIAVAGDGAAYLTGDTFSQNFPTLNAFQPQFQASPDGSSAFVAALAPAGDSLRYASYLSGSFTDIGKSVAVDASGTAYFVGQAVSADFPILNPILPDKRRTTSGTYVAKIGPSGYRFYTILISGSGGSPGSWTTSGEIPHGVALDSTNGIYVTGGTDSSDFPVTASAFQKTLGFDSRVGVQSDAFALKLLSPGYAVTLSSANNNVAATDPVGITSTVSQAGNPSPPSGNVELFDSGQSIAAPALTNGSASTTLSSLSIGVHRLTAVYTANGDGASSAPILQGVNQAVCNGSSVPQAVPQGNPTVVLTAPSNCLMLSSPSALSINAQADTPAGGISSVQFYASGTSIGQVNSRPYVLSWTPPSAGNYTITAVATNSFGQATTSAPILLSINSPPSVAMTAPTSGSTFPAGSSVSLAAQASDPDGIKQVDFLANGSVIGSTNVSPYTGTWTPTAVGSYELTARATDNGNATTTSTPVSVTVFNPPASVEISSPAAGSQFDAPANLVVTANASDTGGTVTQVEFFANGVSVGLSASAPYSVPWSNVGPGTYILTAVATDDGGASTTSAAVTVKIAVHTDPGETIVFLHNDFAGNTIAATDTTGALLWKENYKPFGDRTVHDPAATLNRQWFAGKPEDSDVGFLYFGARYYDAVVGRFVSTDPKIFDGENLHSFNRYAYANDNPYRFIDPDGRQAIPVQAIGSPPPTMPAQVTTGVLGKPSQEQQIRTLEGVPSSPLGDISIPSLDASDVVNYLLGGVPAVVQGLGPIFNSESNNGNDNRRSRYISVDTKRAVDKAATDESGTLRCRYCGAELSPKSGSGKSREFDHMNPFARGGSSDASNIAAACRDCNRQKGARTPEEWGGPQ